jgi:four helix bundle protein
MINSKHYDLEERTLKFARSIILFTNLLPKTPANSEITKQIIRSSGSIGANYIEANESLGKKDFAMRIRICRKEAKETIYWLKLVETNEDSLETKRASYLQEGTEIMKIFGAILIKSE